MQKMRIKAADTNQTLMRVIKNPVKAHLPTGAPIFGAHMKGELVDPMELAAGLPDGPVCFVFGAMSKGFITGEDCEKLYSFSQYPVSAWSRPARSSSAPVHAPSPPRSSPLLLL